MFTGHSFESTFDFVMPGVELSVGPSLRLSDSKKTMYQ